MTTTQIEQKGTQEVTRPEETWGGHYYSPRADICENDAELTVMLDMPGVKATDVDIQYEQGELRVHGKVQPRAPQNGRFVMREYEIADYFRAFRIGETVDESAIGAEMKEGVLTLHLPKKQEARPKRITVAAR